MTERSGSGKRSGTISKWKKWPRLITVEEEFEDGSADAHVKVECAIDKLELANATVEQSLQMIEQQRQGDLSNRDVERRETKFRR